MKEEDLWSWKKEGERKLKSTTMFSVAVMIFIAITTSFFVFRTISSNNDTIRMLEYQADLLSEAIYRQKASVLDITEQISEGPQSVDININKIVEKLDSDFKKLQEIIVGDPANVIEFALLIKEVGNLKESYKEHKDSVYKEMERSFGLFQWFIYMNIFIALAVLGIAVSIYYQSKSVQRTKDKEPS